MCPPGHASSRDPFTGRHTGRPLRSRLKPPSTTEERAGTEPRPYRSIVVPSSGPMWASAPTKGKEGCRNHPGQRRRAERLRRGWEEGVGIVAEIIPKYPATSDNPSVALRATAPFAQGSLWGRGYGLPRRFAPRNDSSDPLSFRGGPTGRRGNPSFFRWTGVRAAVPRAWPPPTKFRAEIWGVGQVVGPYGKPDQPPKPAGAQRSVRARGREGWARIGAEAIKKGHSPATTQAALSEAESAGIIAGQIRFLPDAPRVQHGVQGSEVCGKPRPCSRRDCVN